MYTVSKSFDVAAGHRLQDHKGKCFNVHGHNYRFDVTVGCRELTVGGMVIDFGPLKSIIAPFIAEWDHAFIYEEGDPVGEAIALMGMKVYRLPRGIAPTSEHLARYLASKVDRHLQDTPDLKTLWVTAVACWEGPVNAAHWHADPRLPDTGCGTGSTPYTFV